MKQRGSFMAENFEPSHVPQHSRRSKLRVSPNSFNGDPLGPDLPLHLNLEAPALPRRSRNFSVPLGPFTGYASILQRSRFLRPAEEVLEGFCGVDWGIKDEGRRRASSYLADPSLQNSSEIEIMRSSDASVHAKLRLLSLLEEVYKRYKLYSQQMQSVVLSFEAVVGLENAAPYVICAFKTMWKHFKCLKNAILDQICLVGKTSPLTSVGRDHSLGPWTTDRSSPHGENSVQNSTVAQPHLWRSQSQPHLWRSQRGLPDQAVTVLRSWLFDHFLHPYPNDLDKQMLAQQTGLSKTQVSNWFINARVRLWKPMLMQEMHMLPEVETQLHLPSPLPSETPSRTAPTRKATPGASSKRSRNEPSRVPEQIEDQVKSSRTGLLSNWDGVSWSSGEGERGISLGLDLNQGDGIQISQSFPNDAALPPGPGRKHLRPT